MRMYGRVLQLHGLSRSIEQVAPTKMLVNENVDILDIDTPTEVRAENKSAVRRAWRKITNKIKKTFNWFK